MIDETKRYTSAKGETKTYKEWKEWDQALNESLQRAANTQTRHKYAMKADWFERLTRILGLHEEGTECTYVRRGRVEVHSSLPRYYEGDD